MLLKNTNEDLEEMSYLHPGYFKKIFCEKVCIIIYFSNLNFVKLLKLKKIYMYNTYIWRRAWQATPVFLPEESHVQRSWAG